MQIAVNHFTVFSMKRMKLEYKFPVCLPLRVIFPMYGPHSGALRGAVVTKGLVTAVSIAEKRVCPQGVLGRERERERERTWQQLSRIHLKQYM